MISVFIFIGLAALIHVYIFIMESLLWGRPRINKIFGMSAAQAEHNRLFAFNQGFYNLFLAIAAALGIWLTMDLAPFVGAALMAYAALSMVGASLVLLYSNKKLFRASLIQGLPPLIALIIFGWKFFV